MEVSLALAVLLSATVLLSQFVVASAQQRRASDQRRIALEELSNRMERALAAKWDGVDAATIEKQPLPQLAAEMLPVARLSASVMEEPGPAKGKQVQLVLSWENRAGQRVAPLSITAWKHRRQEAQP